MGRISKAEKAKYRHLDPKVPGTCYYCSSQDHRMMDDLTPAKTASDAAKDAFAEEWTITTCCRACWHAIYTANVANGGLKFRAQKGCMTIGQKRRLLSKTSTDIEAGPDFVWLGGGSLIVPKDTLVSDMDEYFWNSHRITLGELQALQGCMLVKLNNLSNHIQRLTFEGAMASGNLENEREELYMAMVNYNRIPQPTSSGW